ncbi:class I SAM-dependent methyltransferase [Nocardia sp. NPDC050793]|uniref:class I SAM-dependent DNA methyltransferase n=1 Tax=Nocardia sp. NPDC050793 TaxID=3155159 RepID=UPI0033CCCE0D
MPTFADFDRRNYRSVDVVTGYDGWAPTYDDIVMPEMDLALLDRLEQVDWMSVHSAADLGCGTGRTGAWLRGRGITRIDGVDLSPGMLSRAATRGAHSTLTLRDVRDTGLRAETYDLVIASLIDEHLPDLAPLYSEAYRLAVRGGFLVMVSYHPQFMMVSGMPTHYTSWTGEPVAISTHLHLFTDRLTAAAAAGWQLMETSEALVDDTWIESKPKWGSLIGHPFSVALVWRKPS